MLVTGVLLHGLCFVFPCQCPPSILIASLFISVIIAPCLIHFVIHVTGTTALGSLFGEARLLLIDLMADKWLCGKRYGLLQERKKEQKLNPGFCRQSHLSSFQYWYPLCLWIIWLSSVLWPSSPCQIGHLGQRPADNAILIDGFHSLIVSSLLLMALPTQLKDHILDESEFKLHVQLAMWCRYNMMVP